MTPNHPAHMQQLRSIPSIMADSDKIKKIVTVDFDDGSYSESQRDMAQLLLGVLEEVQKDRLEGLCLVGIAHDGGVLRQLILADRASSFTMLGALAYAVNSMATSMWAAEHPMHGDDEDEDKDDKPIRH